LSYAGPVLATSRVVKERSARSGRYAGAGRKRLARVEIWYPTRDSSPEDHVSETCAYSHSSSGASQTKSPGTFRCNPGSRGSGRCTRYASPAAQVARAQASRGCAMNRGSLGVRTCRHVRAGEARRARQLFSPVSRIPILSCCKFFASTSTPKQKARSACAVRALGKAGPSTSAVSRGRTHASLAVFQAIEHRPLPSTGRARPLQISNCRVLFHSSLNHKGAHCGTSPS